MHTRRNDASISCYCCYLQSATWQTNSLVPAVRLLEYRTEPVVTTEDGGRAAA
ncbi:hypothetical protein J3F83DRAFT_726819 [Trichoderma novae-zelandiae]